jgi:hypothetical protein
MTTVDLSVVMWSSMTRRLRRHATPQLDLQRQRLRAADGRCPVHRHPERQLPGQQLQRARSTRQQRRAARLFDSSHRFTALNFRSLRTVVTSAGTSGGRDVARSVTGTSSCGKQAPSLTERSARALCQVQTTAVPHGNWARVPTNLLTHYASARRASAARIHPPGVRASASPRAPVGPPPVGGGIAFARRSRGPRIRR